ncbi:MAG: hypothetical protein PHT15_07015 [Gallionellaceae bacterium]|nr:hypothetical protein [Gallionellaceae bacterium]
MISNKTTTAGYCMQASRGMGYELYSRRGGFTCNNPGKSIEGEEIWLLLLVDEAENKTYISGKQLAAESKS